MKEAFRDKGRLWHIIQYAGNVEKMVCDITFEHFENNMIRYYVVIKNIEIIGETAYVLSKVFIITHPEMSWPQIIGMRPVLVHGYATVSKMKLWKTAIKDIPVLKQQAISYLKEFE